MLIWTPAEGDLHRHGQALSARPHSILHQARRGAKDTEAHRFDGYLGYKFFLVVN